jgi:hypothetical protein
MPLRDHFHPPLYPRRQWQSFHGQRASCIVQRLNSVHLPARFYAEPEVHFGSTINVDVGTVEDHAVPPAAGGSIWQVPAPTMVLEEVDLPLENSAEVQIRNETGRLVAVIELISEANKDRPTSRELLLLKCL